MTEETKTCRVCGISKPLQNFERDKSYTSGRRNVCGKCKYEQRKSLASWDARQASTRAATKRWCRENRPYFKAYLVEWKAKREGVWKVHADAHRAARLFLKKHNLTRQPCQICGDATSHMHHVDYQEKLVVVFLCNQCHKQVHHQLVKCPHPNNLAALVV